jgi:hypothetical protein
MKPKQTWRDVGPPLPWYLQEEMDQMLGGPTAEILPWPKKLPLAQRRTLLERAALKLDREASGRGEE